MLVSIYIRDILNNEKAREEIGLNPWCMAEGLADQYDTYELTSEFASKHRLPWHEVGTYPHKKAEEEKARWGYVPDHNSEVMILEFKGCSIDEAQTVKPLMFNNYSEAKEYMEENEDLDSKYWTRYVVQCFGKEIDVPHGGDWK